jgi:hypothetical protein
VRALASDKVLLCCTRRELVALCIPLFRNLDSFWLAKRAESVEIRNWVGNVHELEQQLMRGLALRYICSWAVIHNLNSVASRMRLLVVPDVRNSNHH